MRRIIVPFIAVLIYSVASAQHSITRALPHVIVYKTKADYRYLVPVMLSQDKRTVVSYPAPGDIKTGSGYPLPVLLHKGYLLDKRGIGVSTAFLRLTYEQYAHLQTIPSPAELYNMIIDKAPITALCDCGVRNDGGNSVKQLNELIDKKQLKKKCRSFGN